VTGVARQPRSRWRIRPSGRGFKDGMYLDTAWLCVPSPETARVYPF